MVAIGFDSYNLCVTGEVGRTLTTPSGGLNEHIPCIVIGFDSYNLCLSGYVSRTISSSRADNEHLPCVLIKKETVVYETDRDDSGSFDT